MNFTMEKEIDNKIDFLDVTIQKETDSLSFSVDRKPSTTDIIIPNDSCHPQQQRHTDIRYLINLIFVNVQRDAAVSSLYSISLQDLSTCFGCSLHPSSGVLKAACATTGTSHMMWQVSSIMG
jgi:hypothetical protein